MKTTITRKDLKKIHDIACKDWKAKIEKFGARNPFGGTIDFSAEEIKEMINASTKEQLPIVKEIFNVKESWRSLKTVDDAIKILGDKDEDVIALRSIYTFGHIIPRYITAEVELTVLVKAINEGWVADFDHHSQYKYYPYFYLGNKFRLDGVYCYCGDARFPARLCLESREKCVFLVENFLEIYKDYLNN